MNLDRFSHGLSDPQEKEHKVVGECAACGEDIVEGEEILEHFDLLIHDNEDCCHTFMREISLQKIAG
jgi:hypothetical protein